MTDLLQFNHYQNEKNDVQNKKMPTAMSVLSIRFLIFATS